jgi:hypothetical protein
MQGLWQPGLARGNHGFAERLQCAGARHDEAISRPGEIVRTKWEIAIGRHQSRSGILQFNQAQELGMYVDAIVSHPGQIAIANLDRARSIGKMDRVGVGRHEPRAARPRPDLESLDAHVPAAGAGQRHAA